LADRLRIDVWSDLVCPWCHIGLHRLRRLVAAEGWTVDLVHHAYQLEPARAHSAPTREALAKRYGGDVDAMVAHAQRAAEAEGLEVHLGDTVSCNTRDGHRVVALARTQDVQDEVVLRLMDAHFRQAADLGDRATLVRLATEAGLAAETVDAMLADDSFQDEVNQDLDQARALGIRGVPFFLFAGRVAFSGAQPDEVFREAMRRALAPETAPTGV
jgi:predicted DsbA family dithiol-disulfide isomerase